MASLHLCANPASGTCTPVGAAAAVSPLYPSPLFANAYLTGSLTAPTLTLVFGAPFSLTLVGSVDLAHNSTTFNGIPDIPLTDLKVALNGGSKSVFNATCAPASGSATATLTSQNGDQSSASRRRSPSPRARAPARPGPAAGAASKGGKPRVDGTLRRPG